MNESDALLVIVEWLKKGRPSEQLGPSHYGYDLYLPTLIGASVRGQNRDRSPQEDEPAVVDELFPVFANAAWELCRRGVLRPGVSRRWAQATEEGSAGAGFSVTGFGAKWLREDQPDIFVPTEPERFAQLLEPFKDLFGPGFHERAQQAIRCYGARAYLACCAMCGAAGESILLATAIAKSGNEPAVLAKYVTVSGRRKTENEVIGQTSEQLRRDFLACTALLKYWRDEAAHGIASNIADDEAYTALALLLRFALLTKKHWSTLTS